MDGAKWFKGLRHNEKKHILAYLYFSEKYPGSDFYWDRLQWTSLYDAFLKDSGRGIRSLVDEFVPDEENLSRIFGLRCLSMPDPNANNLLFLRNIQFFVLDVSQDKTPDFTALSTLPKLESLVVKGDIFSLSGLSELSRLRNLFIGRYYGASMRDLTGLNIERLFFSAEPAFKDPQAAEILLTMSSLKHLTLSVSERMITDLSQLTHLETLQLPSAIILGDRWDFRPLTEVEKRDYKPSLRDLSKAWNSESPAVRSNFQAFIASGKYRIKIIDHMVWQLQRLADIEDSTEKVSAKYNLTDEQARIFWRLAIFKNENLPELNYASLEECVSTIAVDVPDTGAADLRPLFDYRIFPPELMLTVCEWQTEGRSMCEGDTIVQQIFFPRRGFFAIKMAFGVRITKVIDMPGRKGFSYRTLSGHAETGISTFTLEDHPAGGVIFRIHTFSKPGNFISKAFSFVTRRYQTFCTRRALLHVKAQIEAAFAGDKP
jgi:hypothetical protein